MMRTVVLPRSVPQTARCHTGQKSPCAFFCIPPKPYVAPKYILQRTSRSHASQCTCRDDILPGQGQGSELVWSKSTTHSFTASHLIAPSTSWTGALAPPTPEKLPFRTAMPAILATRQGSTASKLLGPQEVSPGTFLSLLRLASCSMILAVRKSHHVWCLQHEPGSQMRPAQRQHDSSRQIWYDVD